MKPLIILGCGNFGRMAHHSFTQDTDYDVVAFAVDAEFLHSPTFQDIPVVAFEEIEAKYPPESHDLFVAVGLRNLNQLRAVKVREAEEKGYRVASYVSTRAIVSPDLEVGPNTWIMETAHVHPFVDIGRNTIIWSRSTIGFQSQIGNDCWISGGLLGETVVLGEGCFVGLGATIASFTTVGKQNVIGAGALIVKDTKDYEIYRGRGSKPSAVPSTRLTRFNG